MHLLHTFSNQPTNQSTQIQCWSYPWCSFISTRSCCSWYRLPNVSSPCSSRKKSNRRAISVLLQIRIPLVIGTRWAFTCWLEWLIIARWWISRMDRTNKKDMRRGEDGCCLWTSKSLLSFGFFLLFYKKINRKGSCASAASPLDKLLGVFTRRWYRPRHCRNVQAHSNQDVAAAYLIAATNQKVRMRDWCTNFFFILGPTCKALVGSARWFTRYAWVSKVSWSCICDL